MTGTGADPIVLVSRETPEDEARWLAALREAMPGETILPFGELDAETRRRARLAIVANPDPAEVAALTGLAWVQSLWAGVERLVAELGPDAPPIVRLVDPELARTMAEAVLAWTYYLQRDMPAYRQAQAERRWRSLPYRAPGEMTVGILGAGELGAAAAARLIGAGFNVALWSRSPKSLPGVTCRHGADGLEATLAGSDILVVLLPLTAGTRGLLDARRLGALKAGASVINFARGPIVVTDDLLAALDTGHIAHAVLDVFDAEPLDPASPLWTHPRVTVLPHVSGPTTQASASAIVAANVARWRMTGELPAQVDRARGY